MFRVILLVVAICMLLDSAVYGTGLDKRDCLRVPLVGGNSRWKETSTFDMVSMNELIKKLKDKGGDIDFVYGQIIKKPDRIVDIIEALQNLWRQDLRNEEKQILYTNSSKLFMRLIIDALNRRKKKERINLGVACSLNMGRSLLYDCIISGLKGGRVWLNIKSAGLVKTSRFFDIFAGLPEVEGLLRNIFPKSEDLEVFLKNSSRFHRIKKGSASWSWAPRKVNGRFIKQSDIILVADIFVLKEIWHKYPKARGKVFLMSHLAKDPQIYGQNIDDPLAEKDEKDRKIIFDKIHHIVKNFMDVLDMDMTGKLIEQPQGNDSKEDDIKGRLTEIQEYLDEGISGYLGRKKEGDFTPTSLDKLIEICKKIDVPPKANILDLGSGTGKLCILLAIYNELYLKYKDIKINGIEDDPELYKLSEGYKNGLGTQYNSVGAINFTNGNFFASRWDIYDIIFYAARGSKNEDRIADEVIKHLKPGAQFVMYKSIKIKDFYQDRQNTMPQLFNKGIFNIEYFEDTGVLVFRKKENKAVHCLTNGQVRVTERAI